MPVPVKKAAAAKKTYGKAPAPVPPPSTVSVFEFDDDEAPAAKKPAAKKASSAPKAAGETETGERRREGQRLWVECSRAKGCACDACKAPSSGRRCLIACRRCSWLAATEQRQTLA